MIFPPCVNNNTGESSPSPAAAAAAVGGSPSSHQPPQPPPAAAAMQREGGGPGSGIGADQAAHPLKPSRALGPALQAVIEYLVSLNLKP
jgi:hypothetical protein